jgi:hypothetical protein
LSVVQLGADTAVAVKFAKALQVVPLCWDHAKPPLEFLATHRTWPTLTVAQLGAEYSEPAIFTGVLHTPAANVVVSRFPLVAVAAQITLPLPSLVQLGLLLTAPAKLFHAPHALPLN